MFPGVAWGRGLLALAVLVLYLAGVHELLLLFAAGLAWALARRPARRGPGGGPGLFVLGGPGALGAPAGPGGPGASLLAAAGAAVPFHLGTLFWTFLKIGSVLYGSGYVLLAFLRRDLVERLGWLTDRQLLDAVAVGQFTPGPVFTTATFVGYVTGGLAGAALATLGIFLPSFLFVAAVRPVADRLRRSPWTADLLDGINAASLALMAGVTLQLARQALGDAFTAGEFVAALALLVRTRVNSAWLIAAGAVAGLVAGR